MGLSREAAVEFIARMLALAENNPNENERQVALAKANEWLLRYNLNLDEIPDPTQPNTPNREYVNEVLLESWPRYADFILPILQEFWFVKIIRHTIGRRKNVSYIIGEPHNIALARRVLEYLADQYTLGWKFYQLTQNAPNSHQQSYFAGVTQGFREKLREQRNASLASDNRVGTALVVVDNELDAALRKHYPQTSTHQAKLSNFVQGAYGQGRQDGKNLSVQERIR